MIVSKVAAAKAAAAYFPVTVRIRTSRSPVDLITSLGVPKLYIRDLGPLTIPDRNNDIDKASSSLGSITKHFHGLLPHFENRTKTQCQQVGIPPIFKQFAGFHAK